MNRGDIVALLRSEARRRPHIAEMLDRAHLLTDEEIDNAKVPLKWFKQALREARAREQRERAIAETEAAMGPLVVLDTGVNTKRGRRLQYTGPGFFTKSSTGMEVEVKNYDWFFLPMDNAGAWQNQTFFDIVPLEVLQYSIELVSDESRHDYVLAWAEELARRY